MSNIINIFAKNIAKTKFARNAIADGADLSVFKEKPNAKTFFGIFLMGISYVMGLPAVGLLGAYSVYYSDLFLILLGGPLLLIVSHLVFLAGMYLAGGKYLMVFLRWATRIFLEKYMKLS